MKRLTLRYTVQTIDHFLDILYIYRFTIYIICLTPLAGEQQLSGVVEFQPSGFLRQQDCIVCQGENTTGLKQMHSDTMWHTIRTKSPLKVPSIFLNMSQRKSSKLLDLGEAGIYTYLIL